VNICESNAAYKQFEEQSHERKEILLKEESEAQKFLQNKLNDDT